jgi:Methyltransferase domain
MMYPSFGLLRRALWSRTKQSLTVGPQPSKFMERARAAFTAGDFGKAAELCKRALVLEFDNSAAHGLWANAELPGVDYNVWLTRIHQYLKPRTYVEIGIKSGESLSLAGANTTVVGIDPKPKVPKTMRTGYKIFAITSDEVFRRYDLVSELGGRSVDLAFIDGMHLFEFVLRDFMNIERCCTYSSTILVHDSYPIESAPHIVHK